MASTLVNLTLLKVSKELENFSESYPAQIYQRALNDSELRQKLIAYVLSRLPNRYLAIEAENLPLMSQFIICSTQESLKMEQLIHQGIYYLSQKAKNHDFHHSYS